MSAFGKAKVHTVRTVNDRLKFINDQVFATQRDPEMRALALWLVRGCPQHGNESESCEIATIFNFVKQNIQYRQDPSNYDLYATGRRTLQVRAGDCDDHAVILSGLLGCIGYYTGARVVSPDGTNWHIYATAGAFPRHAPTKVIPLDTTQPPSFPGWEPGPAHMRRLKSVTFTEGGPVIEEIR